MNRRGFLVASTISAAAGCWPRPSRANSPDRQSWQRLAPIFPRSDDDVWDQDPSAPHVIRVGERLRMYYHGRRGQMIQIGLAEADASDPLSWKRFSPRPILPVGAAGEIDSHWAGYPWVVPITDTHWHLYYAVWDGSYQDGDTGRKVWRTSLAESDDGGLTWRKTGRPLLETGRPAASDEHGTGSCAVVKVGSEYWMYYTAISRPADDYYKISVALAVSADGGHRFTPHPAGALINVPPAIGSPGSTCSKPFVERSEDGFRMWFSCAKDGQFYRIHYAESPDGVHFKWLADPVLDVSSSGWDHTMTCYPSVLRLSNRTLMFYDGDAYAGIGVAQLVRN